MKKKFLAAAIGAMLLGGSAMAVELAPQGKGDLLISPFHMTGGGWNTEFKLINTNTTQSIVVKAVFHAPGNSEELLDFLIYLTPGDVWTGTLLEDPATKAVTLVSTDDSSWQVPTQGKCPARQTSNSPITTSGISFPLTVNAAMGYVNFFEARTISNNVLQNDDIYGTLSGVPNKLAVNSNGTVNKWGVIAAYSDMCNVNADNTWASPNPLITPEVAKLYPSGTSKDTTSDALTGSTRMFNALNGNQLLLPMTALTKYDNLAYLYVGLLTGFNINTGADKRQVEDALWQRDFVIPFNNTGGDQNTTFSTVTFPTKEAYFQAQANSQYLPFYENLPARSNVSVGYAVRDEEERLVSSLGCVRSPCSQAAYAFPDEVNLVAIKQNAGTSANATLINTGSFAKGWVNMSIDPRTSTVASNLDWNNKTQSGAPALVTYINWQVSQGQVQGTWAYAPSTYTPGKY